MTDDPTRPDDDIVSAVLDGEATPAEQARVSADPVLAERVAEFAAVRELVASPVTPLDDATRDDQIARALAGSAGHTGEPATAPTAAVPDDTVVGLEQAPSRRREFNRRFLFAAAAVIAVLALAGGLLSLGSDGQDTTDQASSADDSSEEVAGDAEAGAIDVPELALGEIDDPETLARRVAAETGLGDGNDRGEGVGGDGFAESTPPAAVTEGTDALSEGDSADRTADEEADGDGRTVEDCTIDLIESRRNLIGQLAQGTVIYQGTPAYVFVYNDADLGGALTLVASRADCSVLAEVPL